MSLPQLLRGAHAQVTFGWGWVSEHEFVVSCFLFHLTWRTE